jgi:diguanylate cyclase (GGDEF)-like protein
MPLGWLWIRDSNQKRRQRLLEIQVDRRTAELARANRLISEQNQQLEELSRTDPLTGLANRRVLADQAPVEVALSLRELERARPQNLGAHHGISVIVIDLDHFKRVNDEHGHESGDRVLAAIASRIYASVREIDLAVRWGGEEFVVLARSVDRQSSLTLVRRLLSVITATEVTLSSGEQVSVTASAGFVPYPISLRDPLSSDDWKELVDAADRYMYLAKDRGRARAYGLVAAESSSPEIGEREVLASIQENPLEPIAGFELVEVLADED